MSYEGIAAEFITQQIVRERMAGLDRIVDQPSTPRRPSPARRWAATVSARLTAPRRHPAPQRRPSPESA